MTRCFSSPKQLDAVVTLDAPEELLESLYARWATVNNLIRSLENYQERRPIGDGKCLSFGRSVIVATK